MKIYTSEEVIDLVKIFISEYPNNVDLGSSFGIWLKQKEQSLIDPTAIPVKDQLIWVRDNVRDEWIPRCLDYINDYGRPVCFINGENSRQTSYSDE